MYAAVACLLVAIKRALLPVRRRVDLGEMGLWDRPECPLSPRSTLGGGCPRHPGRASFEPAQQKAYAEASRTLGVLVLVSVSPRRTGNVEVGPRAAAHELLKK